VADFNYIAMPIFRVEIRLTDETLVASMDACNKEHQEIIDKSP
jgi:hypothetical protein